MNWRSAGFAATLVAVALLIGSLVWGLQAEPSPEGVEPDPVNEVVTIPLRDDRIRVEVLNATQVSGLARRVTEQLRDNGFDVVYYGNAGGSLRRDSTTILDRAGKPAAVAELANYLEMERVETAIDTSLYLEATLILGSDWPEGEEEEP